ALRERKLYLAGKQPSAIEPLAEEFVRTEICPRLSADGLAAIEAHRRAGHCLVLLTGSLDFLVAPLGAALGVTTILAARPERTGTPGIFSPLFHTVKGSDGWSSPLPINSR
ncbi:MAG: hypothetical protein C4294_01975, partial [Nitrospiraceae bacterium]